MIGIIDYGSGNLAAIMACYESLSMPYFASSEASELKKATHLLLPGVGAFDETMERLENSGLKDFICEEVAEAKKPLMGICIGMHVLGTSSEEGSAKGLDLIPGRVKRIPEEKIPEPPKLPHMGWNSVTHPAEVELLESVDSERGFYFLHSYYFQAEDPSHTVAETDYAGGIPCMVRRDNVWGVQFHPEKSHFNGLRVLESFGRL